MLSRSRCARGAGLAARAPRPGAAERVARAIVIDARSGEALLAKHPDARRPIASTTKLMTALLTLESGKLERTFTAPAYNALPAESKINLRRGERMKVRDLLTALLLESANDAAVDLAVGVAGSREAFVAKMNAARAQLGLRNTHYANPIGLDAPANYSSARDLATLARQLMANPTFARDVDRPRATLRSGDHPRTIRNRNLLIGRYPFVDGVKTGHTSQRAATSWSAPRTATAARSSASCSASPARARATSTRSRCCAGASTSTSA